MFACYNECEFKGFGVGLLFGTIRGYVQGAQLGLHNTNPQAMKKYATKYAFQEGIWFSTFNCTFESTRCFARVIRKEDDKFNTFLGGFVGGSAVSLGSRKPMVILTKGIFAGSVVVFLNSIGVL